MTNVELAGQASAARALDAVVAKVIAQIDARSTESTLARAALDLVREAGLRDATARVCVGASTADPTYVTPEATTRAVCTGDLVRVEISARSSDGPFAEAGRVAYAGRVVPSSIGDAFTAVARARDAALALVRERFERGRAVLGFEVDRRARDVIDAAGLGPRFVHRAGEHIGRLGRSAHGTALDGHETDDTRPLEPGHAWILSPGVYLDDWGIRTTTLFQLGAELAIPVEPQRELALVHSPDSTEESGES